MIKEELEKATGQELIDERNYCGVDGYYGVYLDNVNAEMLKRFNRLAELEKENAELKEQLRLAKEMPYSAVKEFAEEKTQDQLTKAKDHIKKLLDCLKQDTNDPQTNYYVCHYMDKAEQFLNEVEK